MGRIVKRNQPCRNEQCGSSDAMQIYEDDSAHCFSCGKTFKNIHIEESKEHKKVSNDDKTARELAEIAELPTRGFKERNITKEICEFFGVKVSYDTNGNIDTHYYPYGTVDKPAYKIRKVPTKVFHSVGELEFLFGQKRFNGGGKRVIITEGEIDALSYAQASMDRYKKIYPVVSIRSSTSTNDLITHRDWLRSFQEIIIAFDADAAGDLAKEKAIKILGIDKVKTWLPPANCKDASDILVKLGYDRLLTTIFDATRYVPNGIITKDDLWRKLEEYNKIQSLPYPDCLRGLNTKLKGMRFGDIVLLVSGTGAGKSSIMREICLHILKTTTDRIGIVALEESPPETARKMSSMVLNRNPSNEEISLEELKEGFDEVFGDDRPILLDHVGGFKDSSILDKLEYMALAGCKYIMLDHITILVSEGADGLTGNEAIDTMMNKLLTLVKAHNICLILVSHLRKVSNVQKSFEEGKLPSLDDIKGSGSIKQISMDVIGFARDMTAEDDTVRNTIKMRVLKCRYTGLTGDVEGTYYEYVTGRLRNPSQVVVESFTKLE